MVSNSKDDHPSKATPVTNKGIATNPPATRHLLLPSQSHEPVWEKIKSAQTGTQSDELDSSYCFHFGQYTRTLLMFWGEPE